MKISIFQYNEKSSIILPFSGLTAEIWVLIQSVEIHGFILGTEKYRPSHRYVVWKEVVLITFSDNCEYMKAQQAEVS